MLDSAKSLSALLSDTTLHGRQIVEVPVLDTGENAYVVEISGAEVELAWRAAHSLLPDTGRWPVATTFWSSGGSSFRERVLKEDFFSRFYYEEAPDPIDISPDGLCNLANAVDVETFLEQKAIRRAELESLDDIIDYELEDTKKRCGSAPNRSAVKSALVDGHPITTTHQLEYWLLQWEQTHNFSADAQESRQDWFEQDPSALLFLPTIRSWDALAYLNWFGTSDFGTENYIALGRSWEERFGAELVAHYGTMLQCLVSRPPQSLEQAWSLACEHDLAGECTLALPGIKVRDYAYALIGWDRWFLHERP